MENSDDNMRKMLRIGATLQGGKYRIVSYLASGGFGNTYLAENVNLQKQVVIKEFFLKGITGRDETDGRSVTINLQENKGLFDSQLNKFEREARRLFDLSHKNIVRVHDLFPENGTAYYVMDHIDGVSLAHMVKRDGVLSEGVVNQLLTQMLDALDEVHTHGLFHLDLKPGNVMVDTKGVAHLIDFGSSKQMGADGTATTTTGLAYTPGFAAPEQVHGQFDRIGAWTDLYALGATIYYLLSAQNPPSINDIYDDPDEAFRFPEAVSPAMCGFVKWLMQPSYKKRPQTVAEVRKELPKVKTVFVPTPVNDEATHPVPLPNIDKEAKEELTEQVVVPKSSIVAEEATNPVLTHTTVEGIINETSVVGRSSKNGIKRIFFIVLGIISTIVVVGIVLVLVRNSEDSDKVGNSYNRVGNKFCVNGVSFEMVPVDGGTFDMGATSEQENPYDNEKPVHQVTLASYMIGKTEVTQELWETVMGYNPSYYKGLNLPVDRVSWEDCQEFVNKLNAITGEHFRLPTEAEWEFAARGGNKSRHTQYSGSADIDEVAWYDGKSHRVASKKPNELGIYDMSGNVWEWCLDWYADYTNESVANPRGATSGSSRVNRGGCWMGFEKNCRVATRFYGDPNIDGLNDGLRLAL